MSERVKGIPGRKPGTPRSPGTGRQKGTPNKDRAALKEIALKALGREPIEELCDLYKNALEEPIRLNALVHAIRGKS
jgi:hypothetical protein